MRRFLAVLGLILFQGCTGDTTVEDSTRITGHVFDAETNVDLAAAKITSMPRLDMTTTDEAGMFVLEGARYVTLYQLRIEREGYDAITVNVTPSVQDENHIEVGLSILDVCTPGTNRCIAGGGVEGIETCATRGNAWEFAECPATQVCDSATVSCLAAHPLTVRMPQGGNIVSTPSGIVCGTSCVRSFVAGTQVRLVATPSGVGTFTGWTDDCLASGADTTCTITMDGPHTVGASFQAFSLAVQKRGDGEGTVVSAPAGIDCGATCSSTFDEDEVVTLTATPVAPAAFAGWMGDCTGATPTCQVTIDGAKSVRARFEIPKQTLDVARIGTGAGQITSMPMGIDCGADCSFDFDVDTVVMLTAAPANGSTFEGWTGDCAGLTPTCMVTLDADRTVSATFDGLAYPLNVALGGTGVGVISSVPSGIDCGATCTATYGPDTMVTLTAAPSAGSSFVSWGGACAAAGAALTCDLTITAATDVSATFDLDAVAFSVTVNGGGRVTSVPVGIDCPGDCSEPFNPGTMVMLTAAPDVGSALGGWAGDCAASGTNPMCTVTVGAGSAASATFAPTYALPLLVDANCVALYHLNAAPYVSSCGTGGPAVLGGTYNSVASRNAFLQTGLVAGGADEEGYIDTVSSGPVPPSGTVELTVRKDGVAFGARTSAVLYSDLDSTDPTRSGFRLSVHDDGRLVAETRAGPGQVTTASTAVGQLANGTWYHVAATVSDATGLAIFVDGVEITRVPGVPLWTASSSTAWVGAEREGGAGAIYRLNGAVDEVRVSDVVRY